MIEVRSMLDSRIINPASSQAHELEMNRETFRVTSELLTINQSIWKTNKRFT